MQCSAVLGIFHVGTYAVFCSTWHIPCRLMQCSAVLGIFHVGTYAVFCSTWHIPCRYLCSVLQYLAYSM